jgi:YidC/Oxa1 family membrane protein insertase
MGGFGRIGRLTFRIMHERKGEFEVVAINDLTDKATGSELIILIVLYVGSQLLSTLLMSTTTDRTQRMIFLALPFVFVIFIISFPAGLLVYWITTNFWTIVQQTIVRKRLGPMRPPSPDGEAAPMSIMDRMLHRGSGAGRESDDGTPARTREPDRVASGSGSSGSPGSGSQPKRRPSSPPPPSPRKKKKRSGRRR